jgi:hypothetical protein
MGRLYLHNPAHKGTLLRLLDGKVVDDLTSLIRDMGGVSSNTFDLAKYNSDVNQVRRYCKRRH